MEIEEVNSDDVEPGIVIEQDKQEGEEVLAGTKIKLKSKFRNRESRSSRFSRTFRG